MNRDDGGKGSLEDPVVSTDKLFGLKKSLNCVCLSLTAP